MSLFAEKKVASFTMSGREQDVEASYSSDGTLNVLVGIIGEYKGDNVMFLISGEDDVRSFSKSLKQLREKYVNWSDVAKKNNVTDYSKNMDVKFPRVSIYWLGASEWYSSFKNNVFDFIFMVSDTGSPSIGCGGTAKHWGNKYIDQTFYLIFTSVDEIDSLIEALDVDKIKGALGEGKNKDALFQ